MAGTTFAEVVGMAQPSKPAEGALYELVGLQVLVVENDAASAKLLAVVVEEAGCSVTVVESAEEALAIVRDLRPAIILVDLVLPLMSGLLLTELLKADPATRDTLLIAVSAVNGPTTERIALRAGCAAYVRKPIDPLSFAQLLVATLRGAR
jgi:CheY-like chemotaxis protein